MKVRIAKELCKAQNWREHVIVGDHSAIIIGSVDLYFPDGQMHTVQEQIVLGREEMEPAALKDPSILEDDFTIAPLTAHSEEIAGELLITIRHPGGKISGNGDPLIMGFLGIKIPSPAKMWKGIKKGVRSVTRNKLIRKVAKAAKSVVRSKITGAILAGAAVVVPGVGAAALGAYAAANIALDQIENGKKAAEVALDIKRAVMRKAKKKRRSGKPRKRGFVTRVIRRAGKRVVVLTPVKRRRRRRPPTLKTKARRRPPTLKPKYTSRQRAAIKRGIKGYEKYAGTKRMISDVRSKARIPGARGAKARKLLKVLGIAAKARIQSRGLPGLLVTPQGRILRGAWARG